MPDETTTTQPAAEEKPKPEPKKTLDSADVEYRFAGDNPDQGAAGFPARDLTQADVDRITYRSTIPEPGTRGLRRGESGFSEARAKTTRALMATGKFKKRS